MGSEQGRAIRRECLAHMRSVAAANFLARLLAVAMPTINALLIGTMADDLLSLNAAGIAATLPYFLAAMALTVLGEPLSTLWLYLHMASRGFDYDTALVNRFIRKPLLAIQQVDFGEVMERFDGDIGDFCWNTVHVYSLPWVIAVYAGGIGFALLRGQNPLPFALALVILPALPVLKAHFLGGRKAQLRRDLSGFDEQRRSVEADIVPSRDFLKHYNLSGMMAGVLDRLYRGYLKRSGTRKQAFDSRETMLDFVLKHSVPAAVLAVGGYFVFRGGLSVGALLAGSLMLPAIQQCYAYGAKLAEEARAAQAYKERLSLFYGTQEEDDPGQSAPTDSLKADNVTFAYQEGGPSALEGFSAEVHAQAVTRIIGPNGSGKSTLVALLSGLYPPDSGAIRDARGHPLGIHALRSAVTLQEQDSAVFSGTILENLFIPAELEGRAQTLADAFRLEKPLTYVVDTDAANLSPGERKKIMLMRAMLKAAPFTILDEPLNHLDEAGRNALQQEMARRGAGFVVVSHQEMDVPGIAQHVIDLAAGGAGNEGMPSG